ncbi:hypothetical protein N7G274_005952 [Stereocaulon virgatum]|uniref:tyrosinase n=1 Tax=Stereocaulon virgatum TaxID=373712 RepID=A0ABR4A6Y8_9LECA
MSRFNFVSFFLTLCLATLTNSYGIKGVCSGVNTATGQRPFRQEFSKFKDSGPVFDLYILSLEQFQQRNQSALLSYYQVAGIHGHPYISWDGVQGNYQAGYCTHGSILFPSWHRPYMAAYEQILWANAQRIAATYPVVQRSTYEAAAITFRIPYWDWAINSTMPDPINDPMITVNSPHGLVNMANPLYNYTFHPQPSATDFPPNDSLAKYHSTVRSPDAAGQSQSSVSNQILQANAQAILVLSYQLIADQSDYAPFSNTGYTDGRGGNYNSLENMHDAIHAFVGNGGHMSIIPYASFDPIFYLHHANVDRLFAIWQAIYPNSYTTSEVNAQGTFTISPGTNDTLYSPLTPFHSNYNGTLYTSKTARYTRHFGYSYPEVVDWGINATQLSSNTRANLNNLYNPTGSIATRPLLHKRSNGTAPCARSNATTEVIEYQYSINIRVDKSALHRPFFIHFFLGPVPSSPAAWPTAQTLIATHSILYYASSITNIKRTTYGQLPLNHALEGINSPLDPDCVVQLLKEALCWRVQDFQGQHVDTGEVANLKIFVVGREVVEHGLRDRFPAYGEWSILREATDGKVGGLGRGEGM